jgi:hypothetical protein
MKIVWCSFDEIDECRSNFVCIMVLRKGLPRTPLERLFFRANAFFSEFHKNTPQSEKYEKQW